MSRRKVEKGRPEGTDKAWQPGGLQDMMSRIGKTVVCSTYSTVASLVKGTNSQWINQIANGPQSDL